METLSGPGPGGEPLQPQNAPQPFAEKRRLHRAPSPARPYLKDLHHARASSAKPPPVPPKSPTLSGKQQPQGHGGARSQSPGLLVPHSRLSRRSCAQGAKAAAAGKAGSAKSALSSKKAARGQEQAGGRASASARQLGGEPGQAPGKGRRGKRCAPLAPPPAARVSHTDSSSDLSDCPSEPLSDEQRLAQAASSDAESGTGSSDREREPQPPPLLPTAPGGGGGGSQHVLPLPVAAASSRGAAAVSPVSLAAAPGPKEQQQQQGEESSWARALEKGSAQSGQPMGSLRPGGKAPPLPPCEGPPLLLVDEEELLREIEELRSENDYLKVKGGAGVELRETGGRGGSCFYLQAGQ